MFMSTTIKTYNLYGEEAMGINFSKLKLLSLGEFSLVTKEQNEKLAGCLVGEVNFESDGEVVSRVVALKNVAKKSHDKQSDIVVFSGQGLNLIQNGVGYRHENGNTGEEFMKIIINSKKQGFFTELTLNERSNTERSVFDVTKIESKREKQQKSAE